MTIPKWNRTLLKRSFAAYLKFSSTTDSLDLINAVVKAVASDVSITPTDQYVYYVLTAGKAVLLGARASCIGPGAR